MTKAFLLMIFLLAVFYWPSFSARFFQDDWTLLAVARSNDYFSPISGFPYRPFSIGVFYSLGAFLFGESVLGFHLLLFLFFCGLAGFVYLLANKILRQESLGLTATVLFVFNVSLFALFYWVATSYFTLGAFFVFASVYFFLDKGSCRHAVSLIFFVLAILSNELAIVTPALIGVFRFLKEGVSWARLTPFLGISVFYLVWRSQLSLPAAADYTVDITRFLATARWYILRAVNLPEGVLMASPVIYLLFFLLLLFIIIMVVRSLVSRSFPGRLFAFAVVWFFMGALPFFFLPFHMSAYYLTVALFGPLVFFVRLFSLDKRMLWLFTTIYLVMAVLGIEFLKETHWVILKPTL